jgi:tetratricopeptide (TPR) repeat protein
MNRIAVILLGLGIGTAAPAESPEEPISASQTVIVTSPQAKVFAGDKPISEAAPGSILWYSRANGKWLMVPRQKGWINSEDIVSIESAKGYFDKIIEEKPTAEAYHHRGLVLLHFDAPDAAIADFDKSIELGNKTPAIHINRGNALQLKGEVQQAVAEFTAAIKINPDFARAYDNRSSALADLEQFDESLADSDMAIKLDPNYPEAYNNRGVTWSLKGDSDKALADFDKAVELFPKYADALLNRANAKKDLGRTADAIADCEQALTYMPDSPDARNELAWMLATAPEENLRDVKRALELAEKSCEATERKDGHYLDTLAAALAASGDFEKAAATADEAVKVFDKDPAAKPAFDRAELYRAKKPFIDAPRK